MFNQNWQAHILHMMTLSRRAGSARWPLQAIQQKAYSTNVITNYSTVKSSRNSNAQRLSEQFTFNSSNYICLRSN